MNTYCCTCHTWVEDRHEHQTALVVPVFGRRPPEGTDLARVLDQMMAGPILDVRGEGSAAWWSSWDLTEVTGSLCSRDHIGRLKRDYGWTFAERKVTANKKTHKEWRLLLPKPQQGGMF